MADGPLTNLANLKGRTDGNGYFIVTFPTGGPTIAIASKYGFVGVNNAFGLSSTNTAIFGPDGGGYLLVNNSLVFINSANLQFGSGGTADGSLSRLGAASFALGNNAQGDFTGALKLTTLTLVGKAATYNNITTAGQGVPSIYAAASVAAQTTAAASIATYTTPNATGDYSVSGNVNVTTSTTHSFSLNVNYTDEGGTARVLVLPVAQLAGGFATSGLITNATGAGPYESSVLHIRCKATTAITIQTPAGGTYTSVTYNAAGVIRQLQ